MGSFFESLSENVFGVLHLNTIKLLNQNKFLLHNLTALAKIEAKYYNELETEKVNVTNHLKNCQNQQFEAVLKKIYSEERHHEPYF